MAYTLYCDTFLDTAPGSLREIEAHDITHTLCAGTCLLIGLLQISHCLLYFRATFVRRQNWYGTGHPCCTTAAMQPCNREKLQHEDLKYMYSGNRFYYYF